jgi:hypothetical protein
MMQPHTEDHRMHIASVEPTRFINQIRGCLLERGMVATVRGASINKSGAPLIAGGFCVDGRQP